MKSRLGVIALASFALLGLTGCGNSLPTGPEVTSDEWRNAFSNITSVTIEACGGDYQYLVEFENDNLSRITDRKDGTHENWYYDQNGTFGYERTFWRISDSGERVQMLSMGVPSYYSLRSAVTIYQRFYEDATYVDGRYEMNEVDFLGDGSMIEEYPGTIVFGEDKSLLQVNTSTSVSGVEYSIVATFEDVNLNISGFSS